MSDDKNAPVLESEHDGIREYDNPLPAWWLWTFFVTIIFGFHYWLHYEFGGGDTLKQELARDMSRIQSLQDAHPVAKDSEDDLRKLAGVAAVVGKGKDVFAAKCAVCHGNELQGLIGPNLTDQYWIHGKGQLAEIAAIVRTGVLDKGMPPWDGQLKADEIQSVVVFIASKKGSQPPNPKAPQGEKVDN